MNKREEYTPMEALQEYGVYLMILGGLLIIAGLILGYLSTLPSHSSTLSIPSVVSSNATTTSAVAAVVATVAAPVVAAVVDTATHVAAPHDTSPLDNGGVTNSPVTSSTGSINIDVIEKLERLNRLRELGTITQEEYTVLRQQIMNT